jgi:outer membrane protein OmpA-like peptidoglycan-associated protein
METPQDRGPWCTGEAGYGCVAPQDRPRFEQFGTNPLFHEYGNTLFYGVGFAVPIVADRMDLFSELQFYHSFDDPDYIPMFEDDPSSGEYDQELDVVQDGGMARIGTKIGFGNGFALTAGWGSILFAEEPMYESPHWQAFAGLTYNKPEKTPITAPPPPPGGGLPGARLEGPMEERPPLPIDVDPPDTFNCDQELLTVHFDFDRSNLTPEAMARLDAIGKYMRLCENAKLEVQGHTDWIGTENYNYGLGNRRARAAVYYLVYDQGIDPARIVSSEKLAKGIIAGESYGETQPLQSNETDAGRAVNRRAQFVKLTY